MPELKLRSKEAQPKLTETVKDLEKAFSSPTSESITTNICTTDIKDVTTEGYCISHPDTTTDCMDQILLKQIQQISQLGVKIEGQHLSRQDLAGILEGFAKVVRGEHVQVSLASVSSENEDLRKLLINAQEAIIKLLTEQVADRARIATMDTQLKLLPDLQAQADRALQVATEAEYVKRELKSVKFELDAFRRNRLRTDDFRPRRIRSWWSWVRSRVLEANSSSANL